MPAATLRLADVADADMLGALHVASWHETYTGILPERMLASLSVEGRSAMWRDVLGAPDPSGCIAVLIAEAAGVPIGFGCCGRQRDAALHDAGFTGEFNALYVRRFGQGRGVGRSLMGAMSAHLVAAGHVGAALWVLEGNAPARAFYHRLGGRVVGNRIDDQSDTLLVEAAYGWRNISALVGRQTLRD